jgi:hypothetical protein
MAAQIGQQKKSKVDESMEEGEGVGQTWLENCVGFLHGCLRKLEAFMVDEGGEGRRGRGSEGGS